MNTHKNASLTPKGRAHLIAQIALIGLKPAAQAAGISTRTARKWQRRFHNAKALAACLTAAQDPGAALCAAIRTRSSAPWPCGAPSA